MNHDPDLEKKISEAVSRNFPTLVNGMGEEVVDEGENPLTALSQKPEFKEAREKIAPWLWVFSIFGFGMALLNTWRIKKIFGSWKGARRYGKDAD